MSFFKMGSRFKHRSFDYIPRFYDPAKEELEERLNSYNKKVNATEIAKNRIRHGFRKGGVDTRKYSQRVRKRSNFRLLGIIVFLVLVTLLILYKYLPQIVAAIEK
ncbi:MAG: hypothetical protein P8M34_02035 [Saprospiraceae bacterium]|nr:hypothetical protein [Saprospiraceae bacterium]